MPVSTSTKLGIGALALLAAFLVGYVPASLGTRAARVEQDRLTHALAFARLQVQLGMMSNEVNRDNYGRAAQMATTFFDRVQSAVADPAAGQDVTQLFQEEHRDPAAGAGPIATVIQDATSIIIYGIVSSFFFLS